MPKGRSARLWRAFWFKQSLIWKSWQSMMDRRIDPERFSKTWLGAMHGFRWSVSRTAALFALSRRGLARATAPLIARMDADDWSARDRIEKQARLLRDRPDVGVAGCQVAFGGDPVKNAGYAVHVKWMNELTGPEEIALNRFVESPLAHPAVMFRKEVVHRHGGYAEGAFPEDYELWLRWMEVGVRMAKVPEVLLTWNDPPERLSRNHQRYSPLAFYRTKAVYLARWLAMRNPYHPNVMIVGSGRVTRRRVEILMEQGMEVAAYIDIDPRKIGRVHDGVPVIGFDALPVAGSHFVLAYVAKRGARELIGEWLSERGYVLGKDWLPAA